MNKKSNIIIGLAVIALVGIGVFGMSAFSKEGEGKAPVKAESRVETQKSVVTVQPKVAEAASTSTSSGSFVASKQGKKYFPIDCGTAKTIKEENKVYFGSSAEAEQAGYERTSTCK